MAAGNLGIHPSHLSLSRSVASSSNSSNNDVSSSSTSRPIAPIESIVETALYLPTMPVGPDSQFELRQVEAIERLTVIKNKEIVLEPNKKALESNELPFPILKFNLSDLSIYIGKELTSLFRHPVKVWMVGRASRHVVTGVDFNDIDLCVYCENSFFNDNCPILGKQHYVFRRIQNIVAGFVIRELEKTTIYHTFKHLLTTDYLVRSCYFTNRVVFSDGTGCLYSLGGQVDIKVLFALDKPKSVADADGFNLCLNSERPVLQCANGKYWCANETSRSLALHHAQCRLFHVQDPSSIRDLIFRLMLESRQGFELQLDHVESGFQKLAVDYPIQEKFTDSFCRHQKNHCKDRMGRIVDFLTWISYAENSFSHIQMFSTAWLDGSNKLGLSSDIEMPIAIFLKKHPEMASFFLAFLRGCLLLEFSKEDSDLQAYDFHFIERPNKPRAHFSFLYEGRRHYLFTGRTPIQIASDFINYNQIFKKFIESHGGIEQLQGLFSFLRIDCLMLAKISSSEISKLFLKAFTGKRIAKVLRDQYENKLSPLPLYNLLNKQMKGEDLILLQRKMAEANLGECLNLNQGRYFELEEFILFILKKETTSSQFLRMPLLLTKLVSNQSLKNSKIDFLFRENIGQVIPELIETACKKATANILQACYSLYEILDKARFLSFSDKGNLILRMVESYHELNLPSNFNPSWVYQLCDHALAYTFANPIENDPKMISNYLSTLKKLIHSQDEGMLLSAFQYLENALVWKEVHRDALITTILELIRHASVKKSVIFSRQICITFNEIIQRHSALLEPVLERGGSPVIQTIINSVKNLGIDAHNDSIFKVLACRIMNSLAIFNCTSSSLIDLFNQFLTYPHICLNSTELLAKTAIVLLRHKGVFSKERQRELVELALLLLRPAKRNSIESHNYGNVGYKLIEMIFRYWPERDIEFKLTQQKLLERIAHCILKKSRSIEKTKLLLPIYIRAYEILSQIDGEVLETLQSIGAMDLIINRKAASLKFFAIVRDQAPELLNLDVFDKLQRSCQETGLECKENDRIVKESDKIAIVTIPTRPSVREKIRFDLDLLAKINRIIPLCEKQSQQTLLHKGFKSVLDSLRLHQEEIALLKTTDLTNLQSTLNNLFEAFLRSSQISSATNAYKLFVFLKSYKLISIDQLEKTYIALVNKFNQILSTENLNHLEQLLNIVFKLRNSFIKGFDKASSNILLNAYKNILERIETIDLEKEKTRLHSLFDELDRTTGPLISYLGYILMGRCLREKNEKYFEIAVSTLYKLIQTNLIQHLYHYDELEVMYILLISKIPSSWQEGAHAIELKNLLQFIKNHNLFSNLSVSIRIALIECMSKSGNSLLMGEGVETIRQSLINIKPIQSDLKYCLRILRDGINACRKFNTTSSRIEKENNFFIIQQTAQSIEKDWSLMQTILATPKRRALLNRRAIEILTNTNDFHDQALACKIAMQGSFSRQEFAQLIRGFINLPISYYNPTVTRQLMEVSKRYIELQLHLYRANNRLDVQHICEYKSLLLEFLEKLRGISGRYSETIEILTFILTFFHHVDDFNTRRLFKEIIIRTRNELIRVKNVEATALLCFTVFNHLDQDFQMSFLEPVDKIIAACFHRIKTEKDFSLPILQRLIDLVPVFCHWNTTIMQNIIFYTASEIIERKLDPKLIADLMIKSYQFNLFQKITGPSQTTQDLYLADWSTQLSRFERLRVANEGILVSLSRSESEEALQLMSQYILALQKQIRGEFIEEWNSFFQHHNFVGRHLLKHCFANGNLSLFTNYVKSIDVAMSSKTSGVIDLQMYFKNFEYNICRMLLYPVVLKHIRDLVFKEQQSNEKKIFSHTEMVSHIREDSCAYVLKEQVLAHPFVTKALSIFSDNAIIDLIVSDCAALFSSKQFEAAIADETFLHCALQCLNLLNDYMHHSSKWEDRSLELSISSYLLQKRLSLISYIGDFIKMIPSPEKLILLESLEKLIDLTEARYVINQELAHLKTHNPAIFQIFKDSHPNYNIPIENKGVFYSPMITKWGGYK